MKRLPDLESEKVECMWEEINVIGYVYRNPASAYPWFDDFVEIVDKVVENNPDVIFSWRL